MRYIIHALPKDGDFEDTESFPCKTWVEVVRTLKKIKLQGYRFIGIL